MLCKGQQQIDPRQQQIIALILIAVGRLHRMGSIRNRSKFFALS
jgi:hypothetical protein